MKKKIILTSAGNSSYFETPFQISSANQEWANKYVTEMKFNNEKTEDNKNKDKREDYEKRLSSFDA